ncbi:chemotaxis protein MotB [Crenobacter luteus]|uniref:Flagellar motor protein MotB n=1 Tax=Crenobacter luteus TaxID=1452487 RepID=A0A163DNG5_9NEIS|nr:flagellar motor protein MotB [Crenobacter luteus]KZE35056.1 flagellar motor protein MotB [Crenobacter luteus]TCP11225.1 chemotaxis protein MotB [Crenobacter luteus]
MADESQRPIVVKRIKKGGHGHHGGAWKIAYADFVTAMMAFFLLMWLLGSVSQGDLQGISEYFRTPLKVALAGGSGSGDANAIVKGGGQDLTRKSGQVAKVEEQERSLEKQRLTRLQQKLRQRLEQSPVFKDYKNQLRLEMTPDGLQVQIIDEQNRPMFDSGSYRLLPHTQTILRELGRELNEVSNRISISGHTDAKPFSRGERAYSNWELSADRANAARRELLAGGMLDEKVLRVVGLAAADPLNRQNVFSSENRRIAIVVLNKETEAAILRDGLPADAAAPVGAAGPTSSGTP